MENRSLQRQLAELDGYGIIQDSVDGAFEVWRYDTFIGIEYNAHSEEDAWESALDEVIPNYPEDLEHMVDWCNYIAEKRGWQFYLKRSKPGWSAWFNAYDRQDEIWDTAYIDYSDEDSDTPAANVCAKLVLNALKGKANGSYRQAG